MRKYFILFLFAIFSLTAVAQQKIALLEPRVGEGSTVVSGMEKAMVRGELRKALVNFSGYEAITRADIDQMMQEQNFQRTGMVSSSQIKKLGEMSGADSICVATLTKSNTEFYLEAYLIHLESGKMSNPASQYGELVNGKLANMFPACQALANELLEKNKSQQNTILRQHNIQEKDDVEEQVSEEPEEDGVAFIVVESMPEFPGGENALRSYLEKNLRYPVIAQENGIQGRVYCQLIVNKDGSISNVKVVRSGGDLSLDKEAIRLIRSMPNWIPGRQRGETVRVKYTMPINFRLE